MAWPSLFTVLSMEWLKTRRTPVRWLTFVTPVALAALLVWYFSLKAITPDIRPVMYQTFFEIWTALVIPMGVGLLAGIMIHQEELAGSFNGLLGSGLSRTSIYFGKLIMLMLLSMASTLLATFILVAGIKYGLNIPVPWPFFILAALMAEIGTLPLLAFHLWLSLAWGMGASIGFGGGGILIAALMGATSFGNTVWQFIPWAWPVRLAMLPGIYLLSWTGFPSPLLSSGYVWHETLKGVIPALIVFIVLTIGGLLWFKKWEGRKVYD